MSSAKEGGAFYIDDLNGKDINEKNDNFVNCTFLLNNALE
jgi:hypothetical protein